jgi:hypothetical protein
MRKGNQDSPLREFQVVVKNENDAMASNFSQNSRLGDKLPKKHPPRWCRAYCKLADIIGLFRKRPLPHAEYPRTFTPVKSNLSFDSAAFFNRFL